MALLSTHRPGAGNLLRGDVPERDTPIALPRGQTEAVAAVRHRGDEVLRVLQQSGLTAGRGVPEACGAVPRRRRDLLAVGVKCDVVDEALVPAQDVSFDLRHFPYA